MKKFISGLGTNIFLLGIISLLTDVSSEMMLAISIGSIEKKV
jgi:hypothetical protein